MPRLIFQKFSPVRRAILTTLLYSDIFSFPLTKDELWKYLISEKKIPQNEFDKNVQSLKKYIASKDGYYCLRGREKIITQRIKQLAEVQKKVRRACFAASKLAVIPSVLFIGITGGLAAGNVDADDDIDFVIITKKGTLFMTRLLVLIILESLRIRRFRSQKKTANTICTNLLFDETVLDWFVKYNDVYTAREIAQILPLFERDAMYRRFFRTNNWIRHFLPNASRQAFIQCNQNMGNKKNKFFIEKCILNRFTEAGSRMVQIGIMKKHQTREVLQRHMLALHPYDYRTKVLSQLRLKMREFGLLTKF